MNLPKELHDILKGNVALDGTTLHTYSHDTSIFELQPQAVVFPRSVSEIKTLVKYVTEKKKDNPSLSLTSRSGGTDMGGGAINDSVIIDFAKYFHRLGTINREGTWIEPGVFYRDFEPLAAKRGFYFPPYPASKNICAFGGMVANNAGGEKTLTYGKTIDYVEELRVVLSDGEEYLLKPLSKDELGKKTRQRNFEGEVYRRVLAVIEKNYNLIKQAKPKVSKNSTGYNVWDVWDKKTFDLTKLFVGSQGTLGILTDIKVGLAEIKNYTGLLIVYLDELQVLPKLIGDVVSTKPASFEAFDDHTMKLALRFIPKFSEILGPVETINMGLTFLPQLLRFARGGIPKFTLLVEYEGDSQEEIDDKIEKLKAKIAHYNLEVSTAATKEKAAKYWVIRRESFNLLRKNIKDKHTAPFIDDLIVPPEKLPEFFPKLTKILEKHELLYTVAGHMGDGNFHIIPLMDLRIPAERKKIPRVEEEVNELVFRFGGSMSGEHNDGMIRGPFLKQMYGEGMFKIFQEIKTIFDPQNIFNPHKKTDADMDFSAHHMRLHF